MPVKNLNITFEKGIRLNKSSVHKIVNEAKNCLNKNIKSLEINFVGSETILKINANYLKHKFVTDVISFDYSNESNSFDGEIFICTEIAEENSKRFQVSFDDEIKRLIIHGLLHFSGYDDKNESQRRKMRIAENSFLKLVKNNKIF